MALKTIFTHLARMRFNTLRKAPNNHSNKTEPLPVFVWSELLVQCLTKQFSDYSPVRILMKNPNTQNYDFYTSTILGFDLTQNQLLLDTPSPLDLQTLMCAKEKQTELKIELTTATGRHYINTKITHIYSTDNNQFEINTRVISHVFTQNKRLYPRAQFTYNQAPQAILQANGKLPITMEIKDLSRQGAKCIFQGRDIRSELISDAVANQGTKDKISIKLVFNDHFIMHLTAQIVQTKYLRTPSCHNQVRLKFINSTAVEQAQIDELIYYLKNEDIAFAA